MTIEALQQQYADCRRELLSRQRRDALNINNRALGAEIARQQALTERLIALGHELLARDAFVPQIRP